jgi:outer membrane protein OmpA-like peptidoglycan-associated protein
MKKSFASLLVGGLLVVPTLATALSISDEDKLRELERAMSSQGATEATEEVPKKRRTRAIVFDAEPQADSAAAPVQTTAVKPERIQDCQSPPTQARVTPVDFAIQFRSGSAEIAPASQDTLIQIAKILSLSPDKCILIEGHTDAVGNPDSNLRLSRERAHAVHRFITDRAGLDANRIQAIGKGQTEPLKNLDPRDAKNRRVVFKVVG